MNDNRHGLAMTAKRCRRNNRVRCCDSPVASYCNYRAAGIMASAAHQAWRRARARTTVVVVVLPLTASNSLTLLRRQSAKLQRH